MSSILAGAQLQRGILVSGDNTVMAYCRHEHKPGNPFILLEVDDKKLFCDSRVAKWLPAAASNHLAKLMTKASVEKPQGIPQLESSPQSNSKRTKHHVRKTK